MDITPHIFTAKVMHKRHFPKVNQFTYRVYYLALPLAALAETSLSINRPSFISFYEKDHGAKDGTNLEHWARELLANHNLHDVTEHIVLISMPRLLGYVFNPVSFWMCFDTDKQLRAVLCEVNNTFGETHTYLCAHPDHRAIHDSEWLSADKLFHVSPFLKREGQYQFRFALEEETLGIRIDYYDAEDRKQLSTALTGTLAPLTNKRLRRAFWTHPFVTLKTITLIHWQAIRLFSKGIHYITKPKQHEETVSVTHHFTKM